VPDTHLTNIKQCLWFAIAGMRCLWSFGFWIGWNWNVPNLLVLDSVKNIYTGFLVFQQLLVENCTLCLFANALTNFVLQAKIRHHREQVHVQSVHDSGNPQFQPQRHRDVQLRLHQLIRKSWRDFETLWWVSVGRSFVGWGIVPSDLIARASPSEIYMHTFTLPNSLNSMFALNLHGIKLTW
jgi:hypothetical protein